MHKNTPEYIVERLTWLLEDGVVDDEHGLPAMYLRNILAGRELTDGAGEVAA